jgi:galactokinase
VGAWDSELRDDFVQRFARPPAWLSRAPGRVNLIGEHTDYSEGLVLPCAIDRDTIALAAPRSDGRFVVWARDLGEQAEFSAASPARVGAWLDYVQAPVFALAEEGRAVGGLDLALSSRVPLGSGLSSSAALGLAVIGAIDAAEGLGLDARRRARLVHRGENAFVGVGCGILDQFASALGRRDHALRIDCRSQAVRAIPMQNAGLALLLVHSGVERALVAGAYAERVNQCREASDTARGRGIGDGDVRTLRDLTAADLPALERALSELVFRRARHVITENARVDAFCEAFERGEREALGRLMAEGQQSLRDDFEVSTPELDALCEIADRVPGVVGSRLTGAGFGGCCLHLVEAEHCEAAAERIAGEFATRFGRTPTTLVARPAEGASVVALS